MSNTTPIRHVTALISTARNMIAQPSASLGMARTALVETARSAPMLLRSSLEATQQLATSGGAGRLLIRSFFIVAVVPTFLYWSYAAFWESKGYVAEARLTVRAAREQRAPSGSDASSIASKLSGGGQKNTGQDSFIVLNYIRSRAIIVDIGGREYLEKVYARREIDYPSRLKEKANLEELWRFWTRHVLANVDTMSGILTLRVDASRPQDALKTAQDIVRLSEDLINKITVRVRKDAVARAELEVGLAAQRLAEARNAVLQFRNQNVLIDPASRASGIGELIGKLTLERIEIENALSTLSGALSNDSPSQRIQRARLAAIDQQIADLKKKLTDSGAHGDDTVSSQLASYERLKLEEQFASSLYTVAQNSYQRARQELEKQQLYLAVVVAPTLPQAATYPRVFGSTLLLFGTLTVAWAIGALITASVRDHMA